MIRLRMAGCRSMSCLIETVLESKIAASAGNEDQVIKTKRFPDVMCLPDFSFFGRRESKKLA